jgi:hypothetical protein
MNNLQLINNQIEIFQGIDTINTLVVVNDRLNTENVILNNNINTSRMLANTYWQAEAEKNSIFNNEIAKYNSLKNGQDYILNRINNVFSTNLWKYKDKFYYRPNYNDELIVGTKDEIALEIGSKYSCNIKFVDDLNKIRTKDMRKIGIDTTYIAINSIPIVEKEIFNLLSSVEIYNNFGIVYRNLFQYTPYLQKRFSQTFYQERSVIADLLKNVIKVEESEFILKWLGKYFTTLHGNQDILVLIGNKELSEEILYRKIVNPIFGHKYCVTITEDVLKNQSIEEILKHKLFFNITYIPDNERDLKKLKEIIHSILLKSYQKPNNESVEVFGQIIITVDNPHPFIKEIINSCKIFFLKPMEDIKEILNIKDEITLYKGITNHLDLFCDELNYFGKKGLELKDYGTNNQEFLELVSEFNVTELKSFSNYLILNPLDDDFDILIPLSERYKHTYITGQSGSGKSEIVKTLLLRDIERNDCSVILLDPHGDLSLEIVKKIKDKNRLILIDPSLDDEKTPTINLFEFEDKSEKNIREVTKIILSVIKDINEDSPISVGMEDILNSCIPVLLRKGNSDFRELYKFMNDNRNKDLVELGKKSPNDLEKEFFEDYFGDNNKNITKESIRKRLKTLLNDEIFSNLMNGKSTINLEKEMNTKGRIIIFRISKNKMLDTYKYYTRFILGLIQMIALKRADLKEANRVHTHLFIDEFHNFITPSIEEILTESRKYKLFLTLAHQSVSQISSPKLRDIILSNTNVKIIGNNSNKTLEAMNKTLNEKLVDVENLEIGEFYIKAGNNPLIKVKNSDEYIGDKNSLSEDEWNESKEYQLNHYYRDIKVINQAEEIDRKVDEFIAAILSKNLSYFEKIKEKNETLYEELIYNLNDENGFIAQPLLSKYFGIINDNNHFSENKVFLQKLKEKNEFFNQDLDKNKTYKSKKRYLL